MSFNTHVELSPRDVKTQHTTKRHPLGTRGMTADGRVFRYAYAGGTNLVMGVPVTTAALVLLDQDTAYATSINDTEDISTTWRSFTVETETATGEIAKNEYADGYVRIAYSTGSGTQGQMISIKSNDVSATSSTDAAGSTMTVTFGDGDELTAALDTGAVAVLHHNPYWGVVACAGGGTQTGVVVGVPVRPLTANYYGWIQTWGPCVVCQEGTAATGQLATVSTATDEALALVEYRTSTNSTQILTADTDADAGIGYINGVAITKQHIGYAMGSPGTTLYFELYFLTISP